MSPGPDTILVLSRTLASGALAGFMVLIGTQVGNVMQAVSAGVGVSTIILLFPPAFLTLKWVGAVYLVYLAIQAWRAAAIMPSYKEFSIKNRSAARFVFQGLIGNLTNPKMVVFFVALFPQFISPQNGSSVIQSIILGVTLAAMAMVWIGLLVMISGYYRKDAAYNRTFLLIANRLASLTFLGLALRVALERG
jgi:threonine/homoserine/homoserine lactone efflux protein